MGPGLTPVIGQGAARGDGEASHCLTGLQAFSCGLSVGPEA